jgi:hypothetical protein
LTTKTDASPITVSALDPMGLYFPRDPHPSLLLVGSLPSRSLLVGLVCALGNHLSDLPHAGARQGRAGLSRIYGMALMTLSGVNPNDCSLEPADCAFCLRLTSDEAEQPAWKQAFEEFRRLTLKEQTTFVEVVFDEYRAAGAGVAKRRALLAQADKFLESIEKTLAGGMR